MKNSQNFSFSNMFELVVPFEPVAKGRPRVGRHGVYTPGKTRKYEKLIRDFTIGKFSQPPITTACAVYLYFYLERPKSVTVSKRLFPTVRPDIDNYVKAVLDSLQPHILADDSCVVDLTCKKRYATDYNSGTKIIICY